MLTDPMALVTDSALGVAALLFASRLWRRRRMWALAFGATAVASLAGGVYHGFGDEWRVLWKVTVMAVGIASFFLLAGTHRRLAAIAVVKLVIYVSWMIGHDDFVYVIADYGLTLILVALVHPAKRWILGCIGVSVIGALVQQSGFTIHPRWFDEDDLYHLIQIVALWMLYRGGVEERGRDAAAVGVAAR